jgi:hypothetical protein
MVVNIPDFFYIYPSKISNQPDAPLHLHRLWQQEGTEIIQEINRLLKEK